MIRIFATDNHGEREEISDLYWFEEHGVHNFDEGGGGFSSWGDSYTFEIFVDGVKVYPKG